MSVNPIKLFGKLRSYVYPVPSVHTYASNCQLPYLLHDGVHTDMVESIMLFQAVAMNFCWDAANASACSLLNTCNITSPVIGHGKD